MKNLKKYGEEVYKCSGCGICHDICPVFEITKRESAVSRGKFKLLNALINQDIKPSKRGAEIMDLCLHCNACSEFCPSGINAQKIIACAKSDFYAMGFTSPVKRLLSTVFSSRLMLSLIKFAANLYRNFKILDIVEFVNNKTFQIKKIKLLNSILKINVKKNPTNAIPAPKYTAAYFKGCINTYFNPSCANAVGNICNSAGIKLLEVDFQCCGLPSKNIGDVQTYIRLARKNIDTALKSLEQADYIITDCSTCASAFEEYSQDLPEELALKAQEISQKFISVYELLEIIDFKTDLSNQTVTYHDPCHTTRFKKTSRLPRKLLANSGVNLTEMKDSTKCCGAAGSFMLTNPDLSEQISTAKAQNIIATKADIVLTSCPSCTIGLNQGLINQKSNVKVMQLVEFLARN
ncbi:MAG: (Fe-S)-binding protein [Candidatus Gastranaerophilales bacterium]|nr:(Fe-S)-binding protein [Candidatus Gastranaerophilales bacterium]